MFSPDTVEISDESDLLRPDKGVLPRASHYSAALGSTALYLGLGLADCYYVCVFRCVAAIGVRTVLYVPYDRAAWAGTGSFFYFD
jgi:hypothetical protein